MTKRVGAERSKGVFLQIWHPGTDIRYLQAAADAGVRAFVIEGYHSGTLPTSQDMPPEYNAVNFLNYARGKNIPVFMTFRESVTDPHNKYGFKPFDEGKPGGYESSRPAITAGLVPLRANSSQTYEVCKSLEQILSDTASLESIEDRMYSLFPFKTPLQQIRASTLNSE